MKRLAFAATALAILAAVPAYADIAPDPTPVEPTASMEWEKVEITVGAELATVTAEFEIKIGDLDPLKYCRALPTGGSECSKPYYAFRISWPLLDTQVNMIDDFEVTMDGKPANAYPDVIHEEARLTPPISKWIPIDSVEGWAKKPSKVRVRVSYKERITLEGDTAKFTYVLRSGSLWKGSIGKADITVTPEAGVVLEGVSPPPASNKKGVLTWSFKKLEPDKDLQMTIRTKPVDPTKP